MREVYQDKNLRVRHFIHAGKDTLLISHTGFSVSLGELRVINLLQYGVDDKEIAEKLDISFGTVRTQIQEAKAKNRLASGELPSTIQLVTQAYSRGLIFPVVMQHLESLVATKGSQ